MDKTKNNHKENLNTKDKATENRPLLLLDYDYKSGYRLLGVEDDGELVDTLPKFHSDPVAQGLLDKLRADISFTDNSFTIDWGDDFVEDQEVAFELGVDLLEDHGFLETLLTNNLLVNNNFSPLTYNQCKKTDLKLVVIQEGNLYKSFFALKDNHNKVNFISSNTFIIKNMLYEITDSECAFLELKEFVTTFDASKCDSFLSLAYNFLDEIAIEFLDFTFKSVMIPVVPQLIIEKISVDNSLYILFDAKIGGVNYNFINRHKLKEVLSANFTEKQIEISEIDFSNFESAQKDVLEALIAIQRRKKLKRGFYLEGQLLIIHEGLAKDFIKESLLQLTEIFQIVGSHKLKKYKIKYVRPKLLTKLNHSVDFLEGEAFIEIDDEQFSVADLLKSDKENSYVILSDNTTAIIDPKYIKQLERAFQVEDDKVKVSFYDLPLVENIIQSKVDGCNFPLSKNLFHNFNNLNESKIDTKYIHAVLRPYQEYGYKWLHHLLENNLGGCLADDMGLGKTLQAISILSYYHLENKSKCPSLIVMPKSLIYNWSNEIEKFAPKLKVDTYYGLDRKELVFNESDIILTTYGTVRNDIKTLREEKFNIVILDESQNIKNINSQTTKAIMLLNSKNRVALSGTPIENNLGELYSLFRFLNPPMFGSIEDFNTHYGVPIQRDGDSQALEDLKKKIYPFILRRTKQEVLKDLPDKIENTLYIEMEAEQKYFYEMRRKHYQDLIGKKIGSIGIKKSQFFILQALNELRQIASCPESKDESIVRSAKREALIEQIVEATDNNHKILVFTNFVKSIDLICQDLDYHNIGYLKMTGSTKDRQSLVDEFQNNNECKVFVMTLKTGGVGLNLTAADTIFIYDPWWNKTAEDQAVDRAYRMGQDRTVFSYKLITKKTIEEKILQLQKEKNRLLSDLMSSDSTSIKFLNEEDIKFILSD